MIVYHKDAPTIFWWFYLGNDTEMLRKELYIHSDNI